MPTLTIYECPQCGKRSEETQAGSAMLAGWINLSVAPGSFALSAGNAPGAPEWLCSWVCVEGFAAERK